MLSQFIFVKLQIYIRYKIIQEGKKLEVPLQQKTFTLLLKKEEDIRRIRL